MIDYIGNMIYDITEYMKGESSTPAAHHLFDIARYTENIFQSDTDLFHHFVAQLLYLSNRERPSIHLEVSLICTRVRGPDTDDYRNLARVTNYIQGAIGLSLILSIKKSGNIKWYVDAEFELHKEMRSQTGALITMGTGGPYV